MRARHGFGFGRLLRDHAGVLERGTQLANATDQIGKRRAIEYEAADRQLATLHDALRSRVIEPGDCELDTHQLLVEHARADGIRKGLADLRPILISQLCLTCRATIVLPARADPLAVGDCTWVDEGAPALVQRYDVGRVTLGPERKMTAIVAASRELAESSDAESVLNLMLRESCTYSLDSAVFSNAAASSARPAGLMAGITALTPSAATDKDQAMRDDLSALAAAVASAGSGLAFAMHAKQAAAVRLRRGSLWDPTIPIWPTIGAAPGVVIALDPAAIASLFKDKCVRILL